MVNPTGYTALDMIGFTDKGTYSSSANYVRNDLAHYSGNVWRCLVDDTTGIAPVEGVNWTLFIGEPTNLVERIIAPVETDPATNAWTVGRQIIFNDNLYEVITAISAGDALVTYEDDPTNANIKLADPVETQVLAQKTQIQILTNQLADMTPYVQAISNPNLLDNPWFTVNQRNFTTTNANEYTVDRWRTFASSGDTTYTLNSDGIFTIDNTSGESPAFLIQRATTDFIDGIAGKTITASVMLSTGVILSGTGVYDKTQLTTYLDVEDFKIQSIAQNSGQAFAFAVKAGKSVSIKAVKLELGSVSTLAMDTAPNYAEELLKCQRYFMSHLNAYGFVGFGYATSATNIRIGVKTNTPMRSTPSINISDATKFLLLGNGQSLRPSAISVHANENDYIVLNVTTASAVANENYILKADNDVFSLSADL